MFPHTYSMTALQAVFRLGEAVHPISPFKRQEVGNVPQISLKYPPGLSSEPVSQLTLT